MSKKRSNNSFNKLKGDTLGKKKITKIISFSRRAECIIISGYQNGNICIKLKHKLNTKRLK